MCAIAMRIAVLTSGRQDWGILRSTCLRLRDDPRFELLLLAGGMHLSAPHGKTIDRLVEERFVVTRPLPWIATVDDSAEEQAAAALQVIGEALRELSPDALLLVGDRFETAAAAIAATLALVPIVHLHGGEETEGAFDNAFRNAITKMSHLHLVSHPDHGERIRLMGEPPETIHVVGAPGLDNLHREDLPDRQELETFLGAPLDRPVVVVTHHPATHGADARQEARALVEAMRRVPVTFIVTLPNSDPGSAMVRDELLAARSERILVTESVGERRYFGLMRLASAMLGNSSSGLVEAPALELPVVNIGTRQKGRIRGANVIDVEGESSAIVAALHRALDPAFRATLKGVPGPFGDGRSASRIIERLASWHPPHPPVKRGPDVGTRFA